ncbi:uncharacterized protein LOC113518162 [Galleria mellonella]|uniref:Uncharacterized protein LOC113518162 n=1 Tax=Galleria mellonella TaxID=7137 RepID=A0A6J1WT60_GALME|nr:uncharacterized protein LOC113518162 [Galleria mellonella]
MVSRDTLFLSCHALVWAAAALALWSVGASAAGRYDTATPYSPPYTKYKYIPLHNGNTQTDNLFEELPEESESSNTHMPPSELILAGLRTLLDVVRNINKSRANNSLATAKNSTAVVLRKSNSFNTTFGDSGRGFDDYYDEHHYHDTTTTTTAKPMKQGRYTDPWAGYYDWIINEGSFKFWSVFQLFTAALLLYAAFSAIYYAKFNPILPDYSMEYDDYFLERTVGRKARSLDPSELPSGLTWINPRTFQFILDAISKYYENE